MEWILFPQQLLQLETSTTSTTTMSLPTPPSTLASSRHLLTIPSWYSTTMLWEEEKTQISQAIQYTGDSVEEVVNKLGRCWVPIKPNHKHYGQVVAFVEGFKIPTSLEEFNRDFRPREWDIVGERLLLFYCMKKIQKLSLFQLFLLSLYGYEYGVEVCTDCGLMLGPWCGEFFFQSIVALILIYFVEDEDKDVLPWGSLTLEASEWGPLPEGCNGDDDWVDLAVSDAQGANSLL